MKIDYDVFAFRQQRESPIQVAFVANAKSVLAWAGVPRKSDELLTGYQRFRDDTRIDQEIVPYFQDPKNCSPTAVIIALQPDSKIGSCRLANENITVESGIVPTTLTVELDELALTDDRVFEAALAYVNSRLPQVPPGPQSEPDEEDEVAEDDDDAAISLGTATLSEMKVLLEDRVNWKNEAFRQSIADFVKPGVLIDGQHRITAAARLGTRGLPFMMCGLYHAPWEEQVFQFTVVNLKPKKIPPSLITSIAALSLTTDEQGRVEKRLRQAGVRMREVKIMGLVAYDPKSPFADMVDMAVGAPGNRSLRLGYSALKRVANVWYRCQHLPLVLMAKSLFDTNSESAARKEWRDRDTWFRFFTAFWDSVREAYSPELWVKAGGNRLLIGANLWALQDVLISDMPSTHSTWAMPKPTKLDDEALGDREEQLIRKMAEAVSASISYFPEELWTSKWKKGEQDTVQGRKDLVNLFDEFIDQGKRSGGKWKGWRSKTDWFESK